VKGHQEPLLVKVVQVEAMVVLLELLVLAVVFMVVAAAVLKTPHQVLAVMEQSELSGVLEGLSHQLSLQIKHK
jgi:carbon starvation protein CstA